MRAWAQVTSGLRYVIDHPIFARTMVDRGESYYPTAKMELNNWQHLLDALQTAHIFEFDDDTARLMELTDAEPHEVRLPFPMVAGSL